jgi:hypothetical protein
VRSAAPGETHQNLLLLSLDALGGARPPKLYHAPQGALRTERRLGEMMQAQPTGRSVMASRLMPNPQSRRPETDEEDPGIV